MTIEWLARECIAKSRETGIEERPPIRDDTIADNGNHVLSSARNRQPITLSRFGCSANWSSRCAQLITLDVCDEGFVECQHNSTELQQSKRDRTMEAGGLSEPRDLVFQWEIFVKSNTDVKRWIQNMNIVLCNMQKKVRSAEMEAGLTMMASVLSSMSWSW